MRHFIVLLTLLCAGCAAYRSPGAAAPLADLDGTDAAEPAARQPSPHFPVHLAVVRVQAAGYRSLSSAASGEGRYGVVSGAELLNKQQLQTISAWGAVAGVTRLDPLLLPLRLDALDELRLAAAKQQADVLLVYTVDTRFDLKTRVAAPNEALPRDPATARDAAIITTCKGLFVDVRTGFLYGTAAADARQADLGSAWASPRALDAQRLVAERQAFAAFLDVAGSSWNGIAARYR